MLGKRISEIEPSDLVAATHQKIPESSRIEFKRSVPLSPEEVRRQLKHSASGPPEDQAVKQGSGIGEFGRNSLLEELTAFANAAGGMIVLGMDETDEKPPRAGGLVYIPHAEALKRRLTDAVISCVEPRLPYFALSVVDAQPDGSGIILLETERSILGPHWVIPSRRATIRREDRCDTLSMTEIHEMVLRNSRRFDEVLRRLDEEKSKFEPFFADRIKKTFNIPTSLLGANSRFYDIKSWLDANPGCLIGIRVSLVPHVQMQTPRLEQIHNLVPNGSVEQIEFRQKAALLGANFGAPRRVLGGLQSERGVSDSHLILRLNRDGSVEFSYIYLREKPEGVTLSALLVAAGTVLACYSRLRHLANTPNAPAEIDVELLTLPNVAPLFEHEYSTTQGKPLEFRTHFPRATISDVSDFDTYLSELAADFANAGDLNSSVAPKIKLQILE